MLFALEIEDLDKARPFRLPPVLVITPVSIIGKCVCVCVLRVELCVLWVGGWVGVGVCVSDRYV